MPKSTVLSLDKVEVARQSLIFELIQGEQKYLNDLSFIETVRPRRPRRGARADRWRRDSYFPFASPSRLSSPQPVSTTSSRSCFSTSLRSASTVASSWTPSSRGNANSTPLCRTSAISCSRTRLNGRQPTLHSPPSSPGPSGRTRRRRRRIRSLQSSSRCDPPSRRFV